MGGERPGRGTSKKMRPTGARSGRMDLSGASVRASTSLVGFSEGLCREAWATAVGRGLCGDQGEVSGRQRGIRGVLR